MMRLNCEVAVQNWSPTQGVVSRRKATRASISIGRKPGHTSVRGENDNDDGTVFLLLCTSNNMTGTKYKICGNIGTIFGKFVKDGKATIRLKQPTHELCLSKAEPQKLYQLLKTLKSLTKDSKNVKLPVLTAVKSSEVQKVKTDLMIFGRDEYLKATTSYPESLHKLSLVNCSLIRFDVRILALRNLVELNLSQNNLKELDISLERLKLLRTLNLSSNQLTRLSSKICRSSKLVTLDLSNNNLTCLPIAFGAMKSLVNVKLNNNNLCSLPCNLPQLTNLQSLNVSNNELILFNWPVMYGERLQTLDVSGNNFLPEEECDVRCYLRNKLDLLQECAGKVIKNERLHCSPHMVGKNLCNFLDSAKVCHMCKKYSFGCIYVISMVDGTRLAWQVEFSGDIFIPVEMYFCSPNCVRRFDALFY